MENIVWNFNFQFAARSRVNHPSAIGQGGLRQTTFTQKKPALKQTNTNMQTNNHLHSNEQTPTLK